MPDIIADTVDKLCDIVSQVPVDWEAFDAILRGVENINVVNEDDETILSQFILEKTFWDEDDTRDLILLDSVRHFFDCGYDVSANDGLNGFRVLGYPLMIAMRDEHMLNVAKMLMNAGAPVEVPGYDDGWNDGCLLNHIADKQSAERYVYDDYNYANVLEAYYAMTEANLAGKDYNVIHSHLVCIGKPLVSVSVMNVGEKTLVQKQDGITYFAAPLVLWFADKPLVVYCYADSVVNPVYVEDNKNDLMDATKHLSSFVGTVLQDVQYLNPRSCLLKFNNGQQLYIVTHLTAEGKERVGSFKIQTSLTI